MGVESILPREFFGELPRGKMNLITDVPGVKVGHTTINKGDVHTGVTAVLPHAGNMFKNKVGAAAYVINGFGKSAGLVQVNELGTLETPIILTNTLSVGTAHTALVKYMLSQNEDIGVSTGTVNPVVMECNDGHLSDIRALAVKESDVLHAISSASERFEEGAVGSGTGMSCMGYKGGIGSASRTVSLDGREYTLGALVMSNNGNAGDLVLGSHRFEEPKNDELPIEKGSIILLIATDAPLSYRQLLRVAKRAGVGTARTGAFWGNGSGDIALAFSTARCFKHYEERDIVSAELINENRIDRFFRAAAYAVEEAVISSLMHAKPLTGRAGHEKRSLAEFVK